MVDCPACKATGVVRDYVNIGSVIDCPVCEGEKELPDDEVCNECGNVPETGACFYCKMD